MHEDVVECESERVDADARRCCKAGDGSLDIVRWDIGGIGEGL